MARIDNSILQKVEQFATEIISGNHDKGLCYHTIEHTRYVVDKAELIGKEEGLDDAEINIAKACAWLHDIGYATDPENHETAGAKTAIEFLDSIGVDKDIIELIIKKIS